MWAFGVLLWEIFSDGCTPYGHTDAKAVRQLVREGERLSININANCTPEGVQRLLSLCWMTAPAARPTFQQLRSQLDSLNTILCAKDAPRDLVCCLQNGWGCVVLYASDANSLSISKKKRAHSRTICAWQQHPPTRPTTMTWKGS